jgi:hypothetical protein
MLFGALLGSCIGGKVIIMVVCHNVIYILHF